MAIRLISAPPTPPPSLSFHTSLPFYSSINKKCCFHLMSGCEAAEWADQWSYESHLYLLLPVHFCVCVCSCPYLHRAHVRICVCVLRSVSTVHVAPSNYGTKIHSLCLCRCAAALTQCERKKQIKQLKHTRKQMSTRRLDFCSSLSCSLFSYSILPSKTVHCDGGLVFLVWFSS